MENPKGRVLKEKEYKTIKALLTPGAKKVDVEKQTLRSRDTIKRIAKSKNYQDYRKAGKKRWEKRIKELAWRKIKNPILNAIWAGAEDWAKEAFKHKWVKEWDGKTREMPMDEWYDDSELQSSIATHIEKRLGKKGFKTELNKHLK